MSIVTVEDQKALERAQKILAGFPGGVEKATQSAMKRAAQFLRTNSSKAIREKYDISASNIRSEENVKIKYTFASGATAEITFSGAKIPLYRYGKASPKSPAYDTGKWVPAMVGNEWRMVHPGLAASGHQLKSTGAKRFEDAFVARMKSGHVGIFERDGGAMASGGDSISEIMGSSVAQMVGRSDVAEKLAQDAMDKFAERLEHETYRIMNGFGG